jgi:hypothetical protein
VLPPSEGRFDKIVAPVGRPTTTLSRMNSISNALARFKSSVSKPWLNQRKIGARRSWASGRPVAPHRRRAHRGTSPAECIFTIVHALVERNTRSPLRDVVACVPR